jgi:hypothetical protein
MKKLLTLILGIAVLVMLGGLATAKAASSIKSSKSNTSDRAGVATPTPTPEAKGVNAVNVKLARTALPSPTPGKTTTVKSGKSNSSERTVDQTSPKLITGKVSQVEPKTGTFTLKGKGKMPAYKFFFPKGGAQPKVGDIVDVTYTGTLGGSKPLKAINLNSSRSNIY